MMMRNRFYRWTVQMLATAPIATAILLTCAMTDPSLADELPIVSTVEGQPLAVHVERVRDALEYLGNPLSDRSILALEVALLRGDDAELVRDVQRVLDPYCLVGVTINPESRVKVIPGPAQPLLVEQGWRSFLVKLHNESGSTAELVASSDSARRLPGSPPEEVRNRWLDMSMFNDRPVQPQLSGLELEYRVIQLYSRDAGKRAAVIAFDIGQGTQDIGFRNDVMVTFTCVPSTVVAFDVKDENGQPVMASFVIRDGQGRVYPSPAKRLAPDFAFQSQVYRADGEQVKLPEGVYTIRWTRGPEYIAQERTVTIGDEPTTLAFHLERWIDPSQSGWWSGDHHIHAAGCAHYRNPSQGVHAQDMMRHILGEDLKIGANLTWGPCFDYQKQFFSGGVDDVSTYPYLLRYDVEVSGFGSHNSGHLCLLRLKDQIYPGGDSKHHWPTLGLNTLRWAKKQGAVCGPAHSGFGLAISDETIPSYEVPAFDGIGANEYIVDVTHLVPGPDGSLVPAVDFMSTVDTPAAWELNIWYHTLNCGFRTRISGETDFPCIYGDRVGMGRSYVKLDGMLDYDSWCEGIRLGRSYVSDGFSHLMDFTVNGVEVGTNGSQLELDEPRTVRVTANVAVRLDEEPDPRFARPRTWRQAAWHPEWARLGDSRRVPVELIVNGYPVARQEIEADGATREVVFDVEIERSSWVAIRILKSSHTNPVFVLVDGEPIRASRRSAEWCLKSVDQCWSQKNRFYDADEMDDAIEAYDHARESYRSILAECEVD